MRQLIKLTESDLNRIIKESIKSILYEDTRITYKGRVFDYKGDDNKEFKKRFAKFKAQVDAADAAERGEQLPQQQKPKRTRKPKADDSIDTSQASPKALALNVKNLIYDKALKSIFVFSTHGEVSFGPNIMKRIILIYKNIARENLFVAFNTLYRDIEKTAGEIESWGKNNEYAVYDRARKLSYYLRDMGEVLGKLNSTTKTLKENGTINSLGNIPALYGRGNGRELGLFSLAFVKESSLRKIQVKLYNAAESLEQIAENGRNPFDYDPEDLRKKG